MEFFSYEWWLPGNRDVFRSRKVSDSLPEAEANARSWIQRAAEEGAPIGLQLQLLVPTEDGVTAIPVPVDQKRGF